MCQIQLMNSSICFNSNRMLKLILFIFSVNVHISSNRIVQKGLNLFLKPVSQNSFKKDQIKGIKSRKAGQQSNTTSLLYWM